MPTIHSEAGYRFLFWANDHEPPHVHVEYGDGAARFDLRPIQCTTNDGMRARDLARAGSMVTLHAQSFEDKWHGFFGTKARAR